MKNNGPVTQREYPVGEHETLLSATDLKGRITYANDAFIACSGFQRDELYGKAHNLVRHPDMLPAYENVYREIHTGSRQLGLLRGQVVRKSLEETAAANEQLAATVGSNSEAAIQAAQMAAQAVRVASQSAAMVAQAQEKMCGVSASSQKVADITRLIDAIALQTNMIALNAAVEAVCAGEHGKGFAVVASEVRALSVKSAGAAKEIKELIDASTAQIDVGNRSVASAASMLTEAVQVVERLASQEQAHGVAQINQALAQLEQMTQLNAVQVQHNAQLSQVLGEQALRLDEVASVFQQGV